MNRRPVVPIAVAGFLAVAAVTVWIVTNQTTPTVEPVRPAQAAATPTPLPEPPPGPVAMPLPEIPPDQPEPKRRAVVSPEALKDMENVQFLLRDYRARLGGNPEGTNAEIMRKMMGSNRAHLRLDPPEGQRLNDQGELTDRWGSPYFFHQLSKNEMEIRSAGPDGKLWTNDDVVVQ